MELLLVDGHKFIRGEVSLKNEPLFGLEVGQLVSCIGNGKKNGVNWTDEFVEPVSYAGSIEIKNIKFFAFRLPSTLIPEGSPNIYAIYESTGSELMRESKFPKGKQWHQRFLKPEFT